MLRSSPRRYELPGCGTSPSVYFSHRAIPWPSTRENERRAGERASPARTTPVALDLGGLRRPELRPERVVRESARGDRFGAGLVGRVTKRLVALGGRRRDVLREAVLDHHEELRLAHGL